MSIRASTFILFGILVVIFVGCCFWVLSSLIFKQFIELETQEAIKDSQRWISSLESEIEKIDMITSDWSAWDDTYQYAKDRNSEYHDSNLTDSTFTDLPLNLLFVVDTQGQVVTGRIVDIDTLETIEIAEFPLDQWDSQHPLLAHKIDPDAGISGVFTTSAGPMLVASRPILTSDVEGPARGSLVMGRLISEQLCREFSQRTSVEMDCSLCNQREIREDFEWLAANGSLPGIEPVVETVSNVHLHVYDSIPSLTGKPGLLTRAGIPRNITVQGRRSIAAAITAVAACSLILVLIMLFLLERTIISRVIKLGRFTRNVAKGSDLTLRITDQGSDEIGRFAADLNDMMTSLEQSQQSMLEAEHNRTELETIRRMTATYAHEINNPLTGVISTIQILRDESACSGDVSDLLKDAKTSADRIKAVTQKMQHLSKPKYKSYLEHSKILDLADTQKSGQDEPVD